MGVTLPPEDLLVVEYRSELVGAVGCGLAAPSRNDPVSDRDTLLAPEYTAERIGRITMIDNKLRANTLVASDNLAVEIQTRL